MPLRVRGRGLWGMLDCSIDVVRPAAAISSFAQIRAKKPRGSATSSGSMTKQPGMAVGTNRTRPFLTGAIRDERGWRFQVVPIPIHGFGKPLLEREPRLPPDDGPDLCSRQVLSGDLARRVVQEDRIRGPPSDIRDPLDHLDHTDRSLQAQVECLTRPLLRPFGQHETCVVRVADLHDLAYRRSITPHDRTLATQA